MSLPFVPPDAAVGRQPVAPAASEPVDLPGVVHELAPGDTLTALAAEHGVALEALLVANGLHPGAILYIGERILVPSAGAPTS